jgi:hypothetical protein
VTDIFSPLCIRFSGEDRSRMKTLLDEYDINLKNVFGQQHKLSTKKNIIDMAKELPTYFARFGLIAYARCKHKESPCEQGGGEENNNRIIRKNGRPRRRGSIMVADPKRTRSQSYDFIIYNFNASIATG